MRSVCLLLMVTIAQADVLFLCPSSCVVCSEDAIICHKLLSIIDAPDSTKALMLTDGLIDSVDSVVLSDLSNMSVLALSNNAISRIMENAFENLTSLTRLSLDHNHISSQSLDNSTFSWLHRLETLELGSNNLRDIDGSWFQSSRALKTLQLEGNLLTVLNSSTFAHSDLRNLEKLDLSDNLIMYIGRDSFQGLPHLRSLDLSRNHLRSAPDAFSSLPWLSALNLDLNHWSCTCELRELASFLNSYIQAPDKILYNGARMVCVNTDNPAVQTVLELTDANCVPPKRNITVEVVGKRNDDSQEYIRNVAIAVVLSFLGGVGITLGIIAIAYHKLSKKFKMVQGGNGIEESQTSSPESTQWNFCEDKDTLSMSHAMYNSNYKSHQPWEREDSPYMRSEAPENHFTCHKCSSRALAVERHKREMVVQGASHVHEQLVNGQHKGNDQRSVLQQRIKDAGGRRRIENNQLGGQEISSQHRGGSSDVSAVRIRQLALSKHLSALQRGTFRPPNQIHKEGNHSLLKHQAEDYGTQPIYRTISCLQCHQTYEYRQAATSNQKLPFRNPSQNTIPNRAQIYDAMLYRDILGYDKSNAGRHVESQVSELGLKLASQRSVTFDLAGPDERVFTTLTDKRRKETRTESTKTSAQKSPQKLGKNSTHGHLKAPKTKGQAKKTLKVKLNLNPLRKSRVHPKSTNEDEKSRRKKDLKKKHTRKGNQELNSMSEDADEVAKEREQEQQNYIPPEGESEVQMTSTLPLTSSLTFSGELNSLPILDGSDTPQPTNPNTELPVEESTAPQDEMDLSCSSELVNSDAPVIQEYVSSAEGSPRKLRLIIPEKSSRPQTALDKKIR